MERCTLRVLLVEDMEDDAALIELHIRPGGYDADVQRVRDIVGAPMDYAIVGSIKRVGHVSGMKTIAEFVETRAVLAGLGPECAQGLGIHRPEPLAGVPAAASRRA